MKTIVGILVFVVWSSLSTYWYVCKIKMICEDDKVVNVEPIKQEIIVEEQKELSQEEKQENTQVHFDYYSLNIYFPFNKSKTDISQTLADSLKIFSEKLIAAKKLTQIIGNTDNVGSASYNTKLGLKRAKWVKALFISYGVDENNIEIKSMGKENPIENNLKESGRSKNRRVEISIKNK